MKTSKSRFVVMSDGKFLQSASRGRPVWTVEYPDAMEYWTLAEARRGRDLTGTFGATIIRNYGLASEETVS